MDNKPKVLLFDIETAPILAYVWDIWDQNVALNQIKQDWFILSWAAKWLDKKGLLYEDQSKVKNVEDDSNLLKGIWNLLNEADVVITQNGKKFDSKKLNARFIMAGMKPPSSYRHIDTLVIAKKHFGFTSNKLEYMSKKLCKKFKKQNHSKFSGFELWKECLAGNKKAWAEMKKYNIYDVLALEELYLKLAPWDNTINFNTYTDNLINKCSCGSEAMHKNGYQYSSLGKFQRYSCAKCGAEVKGGVNLLSKEKRKALRYA